MPNIQQTSTNRSTIIFDAEIFAAPDLNIFDGQYWQAKQQLTGSATGRGTTYFFKHDNHEYVLRHYRRGGLIGKLIKDSYLFRGLSRTRAWREFTLLEQMHRLGLPVPEPVAAQVTRQNVMYKGDIIIKRIPNSRDMFSFLCDAPQPDTTWQAIGACIRQFHDHNVYHHDLNIHNVMLDDNGKIWLIDFDKCAIHASNNWKKANLDRLLRSLHKEQNKQQTFYFNEQNWQTLLSAYGEPA
ncbi:3-deoxy-D-manno-octulosonic acid kinase [Paraglaciecola chathamensis]|uniref:3-deoxy-D-manno-octulosonic acid kinase n=1 Tax=Paraglaciecola chathamensis TaxID=368405 RepID=A0ABS0WHP9_9ALTE|nr:3-deoxy-D-manno-octulosonic acid kinase [Paraglaciecola chathamensis]MBJ2137955.1 3-deoxy-D-manno-octulosonic acid kinase [Paraglaciecola chathamensis]